MSKKIIGALAALGCGIGLAHADTAVTENTTVGGRGFIDVTNLNAESAGTKTAASGTGIDVTRFYLILNHTFDDVWSANLTTDFNYSSTTGETQLFVKKGYLQAKLSDALWGRIGSADMPWIPYVEDSYGYRYVEKTLIDRAGFGTSADWGVHAGGKFSDGMFGYAVSAVEGNGYKNPTRSKTLDFEGRFNVVPVKGLSIGVGFYSGKRGQEKDPVDLTQHTASRIDASVSYVDAKFRAGAEYFSAKDWNNVLTATTDKATGFEGYGSFQFTPMLGVYARYDQVKPTKDTAPDRKDTYYNAGLSVKARKNVELSFGYKHDDVKNGSTTLTKFNEFGVWTLVNF
jgi:hypothetical protein